MTISGLEEPPRTPWWADVLAGFGFLAFTYALFRLCAFAVREVCDRMWLAHAMVAVCALACAGGVIVLVIRWSSRGDAPRWFVFAGFLPVAAAGLASVAAWGFKPAANQPLPGAAQKLRVVGDVGGCVLYRDSNGRRAGAGLFARNALACALREVCKCVDRISRQAERVNERPPFPEWLSEYGWLLVNWRPAPPHRVVFQQQMEARLYLMDGGRCAEVGEGGALTEALVEELEGADAWDAPATGLPPALSDLVRGADEGVVIVLIATADVNSAEEAEAWQQFSPPESVTVLSILLPSLPRSGRLDLRGSRAKADLLKRLGGRLFWNMPRRRPRNRSCGWIWSSAGRPPSAGRLV